jgi:hypothetical protein
MLRRHPGPVHRAAQGVLSSVVGSMSGPRVLLMTLSQRASAKGTDYLVGWLGKAKLVGFKAKEPDKYGNEQWEIYATEPEPKPDSDQAQLTRNAQRGQRTHDRSRAAAAGEAILRELGRGQC